MAEGWAHLIFVFGKQAQKTVTTVYNRRQSLRHLSPVVATF